MLERRSAENGMSCWVRHCILQCIICDDNAKSDSLLHAVIFNMPLKAPLTSKRREFILWRIPIWLWTDHWPRFNELLQIDHTMTWNRTRGRIVSIVSYLKQACTETHTCTHRQKCILQLYNIQSNLYPYSMCIGDRLHRGRTLTEK